MILGMTGFGRGTSASGGRRVEVEVASVNHKGLSVSVSLPPGTGGMEPKIVKLVGKHISRGRVDVGVYVFGFPPPVVPRVNTETAKRWLRQTKRAAKELGIAHDISMADLLQLPGCVVEEKQSPDTAKMWVRVRPALAAALERLLCVRRKEGKATERAVSRCARRCRDIVSKISRRAPKASAERTRALRKRVQGLLPKGVGVSTTDLLRETAIMAQKSDIIEELERLRMHLGEFLAKLNAGGTVGRTLEFVAQEMHREATTIAAKASNVSVERLSFELRGEVDRIREQLRNVE